MKPSASVVVPSYRRPGQLARCLAALEAQQCGAAEVIVVARPDDHGTGALVAERRLAWPELRLAFSHRQGLVAALNAGAAAARHELVAFVDDDAVPRPDWLARITVTFAADSRIAAVGGRDVVYHDGSRYVDTRTGVLATWRARRPPPVGRLQWFGRMTGNHHAGTGPARDVHVVKGANMSFRTALLARHGFDERLRGLGSQVHNEATACLPLLRDGYRVVYDPAIVVDHYAGVRPHGDHRERIDCAIIRDATHNYMLGLLDHLGPSRRLVLLVWMVLVGTRSTPGLVSALIIWLARGPEPWKRMLAGHCGVWLAIRTTRSVRRPTFGTRAPAELTSPRHPRR